MKMACCGCCAASAVKGKPSYLPQSASEKRSVVETTTTKTTTIVAAQDNVRSIGPAPAARIPQQIPPASDLSPTTPIHVSLPKSRPGLNDPPAVEPAAPAAPAAVEPAAAEVQSPQPITTTPTITQQATPKNTEKSRSRSRTSFSITKRKSSAESGENKPTAKGRSRSSVYFHSAVAQYPTAYRKRMQATREALNRIPEDATAYLGMELSETGGRITVESVSDGGPASIIGILPNDILTGLGTTAVPPTMRLAELIDIVRSTYRVGHVIPIRYEQDGVEQEAPLWIMTTDENLAGQPYYFDVTSCRSIIRRKSSARRF